MSSTNYKWISSQRTAKIGRRVGAEILVDPGTKTATKQAFTPRAREPFCCLLSILNPEFQRSHFNPFSTASFINFGPDNLVCIENQRLTLKSIKKWSLCLEPLIVRETQMRPFCGPVEIAPYPSPLLPTRGRAMTSGAPGLGSVQPIQARRHFVARSGPAVAWSIRSHGTPVAFL